MKSKSIPKIIHYCWFGGNSLPLLALKCINSWRKFFPDYKIIQWNELNFDVNCNPYVREAYAVKKYAFVSDYARFKILYEYGGIYFDTDVEVIKNMDSIIDNGPYMGCENPSALEEDPIKLAVAPGLGMGAIPGMAFYKEVLDKYNGMHFVNPDGTLNQKTVVYHITEIFCSHGLQNVPKIQEIDDIKIYPSDFFCPFNYKTKQLKITNETVSIHWYDASWVSNYRKFICFLQSIFGKKIISIGVQIKALIKQCFIR